MAVWQDIHYLNLFTFYQTLTFCIIWTNDLSSLCSLISEWSQMPAHSRIPTSGPVRVIIVTRPLCSGPAVHKPAVDSVRMAWLARAMVITLLPPLPGVKRSSRSSPASHWSVQAYAGLWLVETGPVAPLSLVVLYRAGKWEDSATLNINKDDGWAWNWCYYEGKLSQMIRTFLWRSITPMKTVQTYSISTANTIVTLNNGQTTFWTSPYIIIDII